VNLITSWASEPKARIPNRTIQLPSLLTIFSEQKPLKSIMEKKSYPLSWWILNRFLNSFLQSWCALFTRSSTVYINRNYLTIFSYSLRHSFNHLSIWMTSIWIQSSIFSCSFRCVIICCTQAKQHVSVLNFGIFLNIWVFYVNRSNLTKQPTLKIEFLLLLPFPIIECYLDVFCIPGDLQCCNIEKFSSKSRNGILTSSIQ
jgi:hypothetical protein